MKQFSIGRLVRLILMVAVLGLFVAGCGGGGGSSAGDGGSGGLSPVIPATTKLLDSATLAELSAAAADGSTLTFAAATPQLQALQSGDVLVVPATALTPDGLLRKVVSVSQASGSVVVATEQAHLTDAIEQGQIDFSEPLTMADIEETSFIHDGIAFEPSVAAAAGPRKAALGEMVLTVNDQLIQGLRFKGSLKFSLTPTLGIKISGARLQELTAKATASEEADVRLIGDYQLEAQKEKEIGQVKFSPKLVMVGIVPVYIRPVLKFVIGAKAGINSSVTTGVHQFLSYTAGIERKNGAWSVINDLTKSFTYTPPTMEANLEAKGYITPRLIFFIYGVGGPFLGAEGYLKLTADINADPWCNLSAGVGGTAGVTGEILGASLGEVEKALFAVETPLFQCKRPYMQVLDTADRSFSGVIGGPFDPASSNYVIRSKDGSIDWSAASDVDWLTIAPASGSNVAAPGFDTFAVSLNDNAEALGKGSYKGTLTFTNTSNGEGNTKRFVYLTTREQSMTVEPGPDSYLVAALPEGGDFSGHSVDFTLGSDLGTIDYAVASDADWLTVTPASGSVAAGIPVTVTLSVDDSKAPLLPARTQTARVTFTNQTNHKGDSSRSLFLQPLMNVSGGYLVFDYPQGGPAGADLSFDISAVNGPIPWTATSSVNWLLVSAASGVAPAGGASTLTVSIDDNKAKSFAPGTYTGVVTLTNTGAGAFSDVQQKAVTLTVKAPLTVTPEGAVNFSGQPLGPYHPTSVTYSLSSDFPIDYAVSADDTWLDVTPASGQITPGNPVQVQVAVDELYANLLALGPHQATLTFAKTNGVRQELTRQANLTLSDNPVCTAGPTNFGPLDPTTGAYLDLVDSDTSACFFSAGYVGSLEFTIQPGTTQNSVFVIDALGTGWYMTSVTPNQSFTPNWFNDRSLAYLPFDTDVAIDLTRKDGAGNVLGYYSGIFRVNSSPLSMEVRDFQKLP
ncbi:hypothetical protein JCM30471_20100 [Desulfuromonas carbonis]|uniref:BACON domain-containing protein n=1 Tax=Desulfuromonas sp. DDH964 TaxID=1823759 RepID=UPI00078EB280|nr:BACON domain-containing carbohydrate-binding protein [Desulfuromonas sp. DDH964]AMV73593.1 hypothetical protein DBW_3292 [Desulfuromonas sp. DDH964]